MSCRSELQAGQVPESLRELPSLLEPWFEQNARKLPWREGRSAYGCLVAEIMLQQTRIEAVREKYSRFTAAFPTLKDLASADEAQVLKKWEGLGYYSRARNLHKAAKRCCEEFGGVLPSSYEQLKKLPGIGSYTAGAIASLCFDENVPAVDGNVLRVLSRYLADDRDVLGDGRKEEAGEWIVRLPKMHPGRFNEALMELGETVCLPSSPDCGSCPLAGRCEAAKQGLTGVLPVRLARSGRRTEHLTALVFVSEDGTVGLEKRSAKGLLAGMYGFPLREGHLNEEELRKLPELADVSCGIRPLGSYRHVFTHVEWLLEGFEIRCGRKIPGLVYARREEIDSEYAVPTAFRFYLNLLSEG